MTNPKARQNRCIPNFLFVPLVLILAAALGAATEEDRSPAPAHDPGPDLVDYSKIPELRWTGPGQPGTYEEYLARSGDDHLDSQAVLRQARASKKKNSPSSKDQNKKQQAVAPARQLKKLEPKLAELTEKIAGAEERVEALNARFCEENYYRDTPPEENAALEAEQRMLMEEIRNSMAEWEALEEEAEELRSRMDAKA